MHSREHKDKHRQVRLFLSGVKWSGGGARELSGYVAIYCSRTNTGSFHERIAFNLLQNGDVLGIELQLSKSKKRQQTAENVRENDENKGTDK